MSEFLIGNLEAFASQVAGVTRAAAMSTNPGSTTSVVCAPGLLDNEILRPITVSVMGVVAVPGEVVRVNLNVPTGPDVWTVQRLLALELEPYIIGVGKVTVDGTDNGIVVRREER